MTNRDNLHAKVRAILEKANHPNTPQAEAETALTLAFRLMQKYDIDHRMAHEILRRMGDSPAVFVLGLMLVTAFLSMWMSNTAAAAN